MDVDSEDLPWKYHPCEFDECEELEDYEPGGFHPVHLGDVYGGRYRVVHKLGFGGYSTVWLARDALESRWVALKIVVAREPATYEARATAANHPGIAGSPLFALPEGRFWIDGPNGRHLCLVMPALGPNLSTLSKGIYSRVTPQFAREVLLQAARALAHLHAKGLCHGDLTLRNILLRLNTPLLASHTETTLLTHLGPPRAAPLLTYSGNPPAPHGPEYIVGPLDFSSAPTNLFTTSISIIDFDQSFPATHPPPPRQLGIAAKYLAPEVAVGALPPSKASDVWALGCAIFRIRAGEDLFFDYDTSCPADALRQIVKAMGEEKLPQEWRRTRFNEDGFAVADGEEGEGFWTLEESKPLGERVRSIVDEPKGLAVDRKGEVVEMTEEPAPGVFGDWATMRAPYPDWAKGMVWKPTAVCVEGGYIEGYGEETDEMLRAFPRIEEREAALLVDLLEKIFRYDPAERVTAEEVVGHPWFALE